MIQRVGDAGKKLHTGRSRNDQVALDMKLYVRDEIDAIDGEVKDLLKALLKIMEGNVQNLDAWIYPSSESTAGYTCSSYWCIF